MTKELERRVAALEKIVARQARELDWLHGGLVAVTTAQVAHLQGFNVVDPEAVTAPMRPFAQAAVLGHQVAASYVAGAMGGRQAIVRNPYSRGYNVSARRIKAAAERGRSGSSGGST